jgi:hypothetical protein
VTLTAVKKAQIEGLMRHVISGAGGGAGVAAPGVMPEAAGPVVWGLALSQWIGLAVWLAGAVLSWVEKEKPRDA